MNDKRNHYRACTLCEAMCGIVVEADAERVHTIRGDKEDPLSHGYICPKAMALKDIQEDESRLRHPVRRTPSGSFERIGWEEAFDEVASRLKDVQRRHGKNAVAIYFGNPSVHNYGSLTYGLPFVRALGTRNRFSATSVDQLPHHVAAFTMFGHLLLLPIPDIDRTDYLLVLGANPAVSNGSLMSAPGVGKRIERIRERGGKVILIDPRKTETAQIVDRHLFIRPGTDVLFILGLLHTLFAEGRVSLGRLAAFTDGLEAVERAVKAFPPERVAEATGIAADDIRSIARDFASARSAVVYGRFGTSTQAFGGVSQWLFNVLNIVTGNLDRPGGAMFTLPAFDIVDMSAKLGQKGHFAKGYTRVRKLPEFGGEYPVAALAEEILTEGPGQIRAMVTSAGNPVLSTPNGRQLDTAFAGLEFMVSIDFYINETTRHANVILPPTGPLEHEHYDIVFQSLAIRNTAKFSLPIFEPAKDSRHDWEIYLELTTRLAESGPVGPLLGRASRALFHKLTPARILDLGLRFGPYGTRARGRKEGLSLARLEKEPHGVDLGPLAEALPGRLYNQAKRIVLAPEMFVHDLERVERRFFATEAGEESGFDLALIGRRQLRGNNSWMHQYQRLVKGRNRCTLLIHPVDAARRAIASQQRVRVRSRVGSIELEAEVTDEMMPGVVSVPHGFGHDRPGMRIPTAEANAGASVNDVTDELVIDELTGTTAFSNVRVRVEAV